MKKIYLLILLFSMSTYSQISYGPKLGLLLATTNGGEPEEYDTKTKYSYYAGGFLEYKFSQFAIDFDINFVNQGSKGENFYREHFDDVGLRYDSSLNIYAINLNVSGKFYLNNDLAIKLGGFYGNILMVKYEFDGGSLFKGRQDVSDSFEKSDYGLIFGAEYYFTSKFFVEGKYSMGLKDIRKDEPTGGEIDIKNRGIFFGLGYKFQ